MQLDGPTFIPKAVLTTGRVLHQPFEIPTEMTKSALLQGGTTHAAVGALNKAAADAVEALQPRGPAKLLSKLFGRIDSSVVASTEQAKKATEIFWVPFSNGAHEVGHAVSNPFSMFYAKRAGFEVPVDDPAATQALLAKITDPNPDSTKFPGMNWPKPEAGDGGGDAGKDTGGDAGKDTGDAGKDTGGTGDAGGSGDAGKDTGDGGGDAGKDTGGDAGGSGDAGKDTGDAGKDAGGDGGDAGKDAGDGAGGSGDAGKDAGGDGGAGGGDGGGDAGGGNTGVAGSTVTEGASPTPEGTRSVAAGDTPVAVDPQVDPAQPQGAVSDAAAGAQATATDAAATEATTVQA